MRAVLGLLLLFGGAELIYLVVTGKLGATSGGTGGGPDEPAISGRAHIGPAISASAWGTHPVRENRGGLLP